MKVILIDDWIYADINGSVRIYGREEFLRTARLKGEICQAAFLNYEIKTMDVSSHRESYGEERISKAFDARYLTTYERLGNQAIQLFAAPKDVIEDIYRYLNGVRLQKLVPYGMALRAFLKSKELLHPDEALVFIDDLNKQGLITVFEGDRMSVTRRIKLHDADHMVSEVKRSWQGFIAQMPQAETSRLRFKVISNNADWLKVFGDQSFLPKEDIIHLEGCCAVLEGLKNAEFPVHFFSQERLLAEKKRKSFRRNLKTALFSSLLIGIGLGTCVAACFYKHKQEKYRQDRMQLLSQLKEKLSNAYRSGFKDILGKQMNLDYARCYYRLLSSLAQGWAIEKTSFYRVGDNKWRLEADVFPVYITASADFLLNEQMGVKADVQEIVSGSRHGRRLSFEMMQKDG